PPTHACPTRRSSDLAYLSQFERFGYLTDRNVEFRKMWVGLLEEGIRGGAFRDDLDVELVYRFIRDTVWVAVHWYHPGGPLPADADRKSTRLNSSHDQ